MTITVRFLVDTGANAVALSSVTANEIGIDYSRGTPGIAQTASGIRTDDRESNCTACLDRRHRAVQRRRQRAVSVPTRPSPLLGASFLGQTGNERATGRVWSCANATECAFPSPDTSISRRVV